MSGILYLGFDVSTTGCGAVLLDDEAKVLSSWVWQAAPSKSGTEFVDERIFDIGLWAKDIFVTAWIWCNGDTILSCSIEAPFFRGPGSAALAEAQGAVKCQHQTQWGKYAALTVKKTAREAGYNCATKFDMIHAASDAADRTTPRSAHRWHEMANAVVSEGTGVTCDKRYTKALGDIADAYWVARTDMAAVAATKKG